jgi:predicted transcriptional regulator of viral defense system
MIHRASQSPTIRILTLLQEGGVLRPRDLDAMGMPREYLHRLYKGGLLERVGRGLYTLPLASVTEHHSLAEVGKQVPHGVVCLLSALRFHGLTTQIPFEVWLAVDRKARRPRDLYLPLRVVRFSGEALSAGVEEHFIEGVPVKIYGPAKTVADCFKCRKKIGLDIALEALRECWRERRCTMDDLWRYAQICRVGRIMRPYLESLT